ncbi:MAG: hypothetical protein ACRESI_01325, partial [Gammaproteobacteria bacterium]
MIPIFKKSIDIDVIATEIVTVLAKDRSSFKKELLGIYKSQQDIETVGFLYAISAYSITVTECSDKEKLMFMAALAKQFAKEIGLSKNNINYLLDQWTKYQASLNTDYSLDFLAKNNCLISVNGKQHINYPMLIWLEYLKIRGVQQNNSFFIVAQTYILSLFVNTTKFIREYLKKYKINYAAYGANWLELIPLVHEPEEKQLQDIFKDCQNDFGHVVLEKITSGLSCDQLPNG